MALPSVDSVLKRKEEKKGLPKPDEVVPRMIEFRERSEKYKQIFPSYGQVQSNIKNLITPKPKVEEPSIPISQQRKEWVDQKVARDTEALGDSKIAKGINKILSPVSKAIYTAESYVAPLQKGMGSALGVNAMTAPYENTGANKALEISGMVAGGVTNPTNLSQGLVSVPLKLGQGVAQKAAQKSPVLGNKFAQRGIEGATAGAIQGGIISGARGETDLDEMAKNIALGAGLGAASDIGITAIGSGIKTAKNIATNAASDLTANQLTAMNALESANRSVPTDRLKVASNNDMLDKVMTEIKPIVTERMTPPLENVNELAKWLQPHLNDSLNNIKKLSYEDMRQLAVEVQRNSTPYDMAKQVAKERGYNLDDLLNNQSPTLKQAAERLRMGGVAGAIEPPKNVKIAIKNEPLIQQPSLPKESWYEKLFGRGGVGITAGSRNSKELIDTHVTRSAKEQSPIIERFKDSASVANQDYVDKLAPFHSISKETYDTAMDSTRANNLANVTIKDKFVDLEGNVRGSSLKDIYSIVPRGQKDLSDRYLIMRDAIDRMDRGIKVYGDQPWFPKNSQEAATRVAQMEAQNPWLKQFGEEMNQFNRNRQDLWVESGIASKELIDTLRMSNPNYVPMMRQMPNRGINNVMRGNQKEFSGQGAPIKRAVGSSRKIIEPAQSLINSTASSYHAMMRNRAMQKLYEAVMDNPEKYKGIIEIVPENDVMKQSTLKNINEAIENDGLDGIADFLNSEIDSLFTKSKQASARPTDNHVTVMIEGNPIKMNVQEKSLIRAIEGVSPERLEGLLRLADNLSRAVKMSATGALAPLQGLKLFARDIPIAAGQSKEKIRFLGDVSHALVSQIADWLPEFVPGAQNIGRLAREYYRAGGGYEQYLRGDSRIRATASDITRDSLLSGRNLWKQTKRYNPFVPLKSLGDAFENIPRIAAFQSSMRRSGWSRDEASIRQALNDAREATVNWSRKGARGQQIESVLPYSNAAVQGTYRMFKFMKEQPLSSLGLITALTGATIGAYEKFKDDPDYQNRSRFSKGIPVYKTENGKFVTIPIEPNYQYVADQVLNFYKWAKDQEELPPVRESIQEGLEAFTPKYIAGPVSTFTGDKMIDPARGVATTLGGSSLEPLVATATGKNYFGGDVVPREYQSNSTPYQQNETTSAAANWAAENLGMDAFTFDYLAQKFGGDLAKVSLPMTSDVGRGDPLGNIYDETLSRLQLLEDPIMKNKLGDEWYKYADKVTQAKADSSKANIELPNWYQEVYDKVTSTKKGSIAKAISDLNSQKKNIQRDTTLTAKQRSEELRMVQSEINQLRIKGIEIMEKAGVLQ